MNYKTRSTQRGENYSQNRWGSCSWGTSYLLVCRQHSVTLLLGCRDLFAWRKKKIEHMHARHVSSMVSQTFVHCGPSRRKKQKLPSRGSIHPWTPPLGSVPGPSVPALQLEGQADTEQTTWISFTCSAPSPCLRTSLVPLRCLPVLRGLCQWGLNRFFKSPS